MRILSNKVREGRGYSISSTPVEEPKKEIPQPIVEEVEDEELVNPDDGEGEG